MVQILRTELRRAISRETRKAADDELARQIANFGIRIAEDAAANLTIRTGAPRWKAPPTVTREFLRDKEIRIKEWLKEGRADLTARIREELLDAAERDTRLTNQELTRNIFEALRDTGPFSPARAELIARTETAQAENFGIMRGFEATGAAEKEWIAILDDRTREDHASMNGVRVPLNEPFTLPDGTELDFPADPSGPVHHVANCRCTMAPVYA